MSAKQQAVIGLLKEERVAKLDRIQSRLGVSHMTVFRALRGYGYLTSYNFNSSYYTLHDIPVFDQDGLWWYEGIGFSRAGTLGATIVELVERSSEGVRRLELEGKLHTRVHNQLSLLCRAGRLDRFSWQGQSVYVSAEARRRARQERACRGADTERGASSDALPEGEWRVPSGLEASAVMRLLVELIRTPKASPASLSRRLQARGVAVRAEDVRRVVEFYSLEKKTGR
jgi:hypothetical protein